MFPRMFSDCLFSQRDSCRLLRVASARFGDSFGVG